ncbi:MAG: ArsR/SmtB family transcription factor [Pyramidobacter sp.]|jgi:DNA-binding transcriptional ArsR family regulator
MKDTKKTISTAPARQSTRAEKAARELPSDARIRRLADFFKIFGDATRMKILCALKSSELCVCDLTAILGISQSAVSHQLSLLRAAHAVKTRRDGKTVYYSLDDEHVSVLVFIGLDHMSHLTPDGERVDDLQK